MGQSTLHATTMGEGVNERGVRLVVEDEKTRFLSLASTVGTPDQPLLPWHRSPIWAMFRLDIIPSRDTDSAVDQVCAHIRS